MLENTLFSVNTIMHLSEYLCYTHFENEASYISEFK